MIRRPQTVCSASDSSANDEVHSRAAPSSAEIVRFFEVTAADWHVAMDELFGLAELFDAGSKRAQEALLHVLVEKIRTLEELWDASRGNLAGEEAGPRAMPTRPRRPD